MQTSKSRSMYTYIHNRTLLNRSADCFDYNDFTGKGR